MTTAAIEKKLSELGLSLPVLPISKGVYKRTITTGNQLFVSGHIAVNHDGSPLTGKLGADCSDEAGVHAARQCGLAIMATLKQSPGGFENIKRVIKILGMVNSTADYTNHPVIINGCSELFRDVWGEDAGVGARSAVGVNSLPGNVSVEIEAIFEIYDSK